MKRMNGKWQGEGWYTFEQWSTECESFVWPVNTAEAEWVEDKRDFEEYATVPDGIESVVTFYGDGDLPNDERVRVAERFVAALPPETRREYEGRFK